MICESILSPLRRILLVLALGLLSACAPTFTRKMPLEQRNGLSAPSHAPRAVLARLQLNSLNMSFDDSAGLPALRTSFANAIANSGAYSEVFAEPYVSYDSTLTHSFDIILSPHFTQEFEPWYWYIGIAGLGPFWPAMPRKGVIELKMDVVIRQNSHAIQTLSLTEQEPYDYFWYGPYHYFELQDATDHLYRKLLASLTSLLTAPVDQGDISGFIEAAPGDSANVTATPSPMPPKLSVAILDPECNGIDSAVGQTLNTKLRAELIARPGIQVMERSRMQDILMEQGYQESGVCANEGCYVKLGQLIGVDAILVASFGRVGEITLLTLRVISVGTGSVLEEVSTEIQGSDDALLTKGVPTLVSKIRIAR